MPDTDETSIASILDAVICARPKTSADPEAVLQTARPDLPEGSRGGPRQGCPGGAYATADPHPSLQKPQNKVRLNAKTKSTLHKAGVLNVAAAFTLFCKGMSLQEIAVEFGVPQEQLNKRARAEDWSNLSRNSRAIVAPPPSAALVTVSAEELERKSKRIEANREKAYSVSETLRAKITESLQSIETRADAIAVTLRELFDEINSLAGELDTPPPKGAPVNTRLTAFVNFVDRIKAWDYTRVADILALAKAAKLVDEASMVALGDVAQKGGNLGNQVQTPTFVINLPGVASTPRMPKNVTPVLPSAGQTDVTKARDLAVSTDVLVPVPGKFEIPPSQTMDSSGDEPIDVEIIGPAKANDEAVLADTKRGHSINFDAL